MIHINKFVTIQQAGREALKRQLEIDEANLPDYPRLLPKVNIKDMKNYFPTEASKYGFIRCMVRAMMP